MPLQAPERLPLSCPGGAPHGGSWLCVVITEPWWRGVDVWEQEDPEVGGEGQGRRNEFGVVEGGHMWCVSAQRALI